MASRGAGVALVDPDSITPELGDSVGIRSLVIADGPKWNVTMIWSRDVAPTPAVSRALDRLALIAGADGSL